LSFDATPSPAALRRTIDRLRSELRAALDANVRCGAGEASSNAMPQPPGRVAELEAENAGLREQLAAAQKRTKAGNGTGRVEAQIEEMAEAYERLRADYDGLRAGMFVSWRICSTSVGV